MRGCVSKNQDGFIKLDTGNSINPRVIIIDSCEYINWDFGLAQKHNCKFCAERRKKELDEINCDSLYSGVKKGAKWYENKMKETLQTEYEKGRFDMREEMMKDAVDAEVMYPASSSTLQIRYKLPKNTKLKYGDRVKIIIIKPEQQ